MVPPCSAVVSALLAELLEGPPGENAWILNPGDRGLLGSLDRLPASAASWPPAPGRSTIAAHVDHLRYGLELLNRWADGEDPFADANYSASWRRQVVTDAEWLDLRQRLRDEACRWRDAVRRPRELTDTELSGVVASVAHVAYHLGAIRQIDPALRGPAARD